MMGSSWANNKAVWHLDYWRERAKLDRDKSDFLEIEFDLVVVKIKIFKVMDSLSSTDLFFDILLNWGNMRESEVIRVAE
jgi:hypothetical protein